MTTQPVVDIAMITYNHERFVAQAIESVLMQETDFSVELVIGEDCSTDGTRAIVQEYAARYPDKIKALLHPHNLGPAHSPGKNNMVSVLKACTGKYVALLEGDDYWTDPHKLQKQVEFLEGHPECVICFHAVQVKYEDGRKPRLYRVCDHKEVSTLEDILAANFIPTCSVMFRNGLVRELPEWYYKLAMGDWPLWILLAQYGKIGYIDEVMGAYRVHGAGVWNAASSLRRLRAKLEAYGHFNAHLMFKYERVIMPAVSRGLDDWAEVFVREKIQTESVEQVAKSVGEIFENPPTGLQIAHLKSKTLGRFYAVMTMVSYQSGDLSKVRRNLLCALWYDPSWLRNRGVWSMGVEAFLGRGIADWLRNTIGTSVRSRKNNVGRLA